MSKETVNFQLEPANLPPLSEDERNELQAVRAMPEEEINYTDIPQLTEHFWNNAVKNPYYKPVKTSTTIRVDSDVLLWLKSKGRGYQTRLNRILREAMLREGDQR